MDKIEQELPARFFLHEGTTRVMLVTVEIIWRRLRYEVDQDGNEDYNGGEQGDLLVEVAVSDQPIFQRDGYDIYSTAPMGFTQAALGGDERISTVDGDILYTVKPSTQTDFKIRLRGKGVPTLRDKNTRGDHYVTLVVQVPQKLTSEQKGLLEKFADSMKDDGSDDKNGSENTKSKKIFGK